MANYIGSFRSNYFRVKDLDTFRSWCDRFGLESLKGEGQHAGLVGFLEGQNSDGNGIPTTIYDAEAEEDVDVNFNAELAALLAEGEVAVVMEVGYEKLRYLHGYAVAVHASGETEEVSLRSIYELAEQRWGVTPTLAEY